MAKLSTIDTLKQLGYTDEELDRQFREATTRGKWSLKFEPRAASASYKNGDVTVRLTSGWSFTFGPRKYKFLRNATDEELADVRPLGQGFVLEWETIDQHLGVGPLLLDLIGREYIGSEVSRHNGSITSEKKKAASRTNGKLGGRPKKSAKN